MWWMVQAAVTMVVTVVVLAALIRRPMAVDAGCHPVPDSALSPTQLDSLQHIHRDAAQHGFRWFGVAMCALRANDQPRPCGLWWNGDAGLWMTAIHQGRRWWTSISGVLTDGSVLSLSQTPLGLFDLAPGMHAISRSTARSVDDLLALAPFPPGELPTRRGWPAPGAEWEPARRLSLDLNRYLLHVGHAEPVGIGGFRFRWLPAIRYSWRGGIGVRQLVLALRNRRTRAQLLRLGAADAPRPVTVAGSIPFDPPDTPTPVVR